MKFAEHLSAHITPEWRKQYISYELAEATRKYAALQNELKTALDLQHGSHKNKGKLASGKLPARKIRELKLGFSEYYLSLILLQNYQNLNYTGFRKILKKHDKLLSVDTGCKWRVECVETSHFYTSKDIDKLIHDTEANVTNELEGGDRQRAMKRLRVPPLGEHQSPWTTFKTFTVNLGLPNSISNAPESGDGEENVGIFWVRPPDQKDTY
ncbi:Similar to Xpr1: Xenotropic and polytropic retrovirus receptor 1 (Mus musculus) [Cotesia congregata]|uniref:Similar to Xpr1: Xenotropic and polytropic retrovirus receptor 1 (Mus musculus) n=1 Tax=Cotesia congregata TaxID=51543 RepID=A0A8J2H7Q3_COTCN|nr:Similar to Xpr1: Xenotropic and polytropic retrovirus receptor 1 (Mus musculus) [Cotesia congregata]